MAARFALGVEYDGNDFCGWQSQDCGCGAQDALQTALSAIADSPIKVWAAGRTDAGVHATAQTVHFNSAAVRQPSAWLHGANALLPSGMAVLWLKRIAVDFHARYSATRRHYQYILLNRGVRSAFGRVGFFHAPLNVGKMCAAALRLVGEHDFSAFRAAACQAKNPERHLFWAEVSAIGNFVIFDFCANGFLQHMARNIVGALLYVGRGKHPPMWMGELLSAREHRQSVPPAAADGLYFVGVDYPSRFALPSTYRPLGHKSDIFPTSCLMD